MSLVYLAPVLTPHGRLIVERNEDAPALDAELAQRMEGAFTRGSGHGLLALGADEIDVAVPPAFSFWREFTAIYLTGICTRPIDPAEPHRAHPPTPPKSELDQFVLAAPPMTGAEYLSAAVLSDLWQQLDRAFCAELTEAKCGIEEFLKRRNPAWNLVGRVHFNLAENRKDEAAPFAFLATYTTRLSAHAKAQHVPLAQALREYAGASNRERLLSLLLPVQRAAENCPWLKAMVDRGEIFYPLRWVPTQAMQLLRDVEKLESAGVVVRMPATWRANRPPRAQVTATVGGRPPSGLGQAALLDFHLEVVLDGERLSKAEVQELLRSSDGLALVRGRWVEVDAARLRETLEHFGKIERTATEQGISFREAMRMLAGTDVAADGNSSVSVGEGGKVVAGPWLAETLKGLRTQEGLARVDPGPALRGTLRPYQQVGVRWLYLLAQLGLGACLADDMGLGKTIQVLALLLVLRQQSNGPAPGLLVAPASLLANWTSELERFAPSLKAVIAHPSEMPAKDLKRMTPEKLRKVDVVITSYGSLLRLPWIADVSWNLVVLDEAQAIKNASAKQTQAVKKLKAGVRFALTGAPTENRLGDLWSIFDFLNPGLLGSAKEFTSFAKRLAALPHNPYRPLRELVRPYILRRLKTDKTVIADLPDKTEVKAFCHLSRRQAALYQQAVEELTQQLEKVEGIQRKGLVLAFLVRLKRFWDVCSDAPGWSWMARRKSESAKSWCGDSRKKRGLASSFFRSRQEARDLTSPPLHMSCTLTAGGIRRLRTRRPTVPSASARPRMSWCTSSSAAGRWKRRLTS